MYIEFKLPTGAGGMTALHASKYILKRMREWAELHNIKITSEHTAIEWRLCWKTHVTIHYLY